MADLMVKLSPSLAQSMGRGAPPQSSALLDLLAASHATLVPVGGLLNEPAEYFRVEVFEPGAIGDLRASLERLDGVEAAFIKPSDELP